MLAACDLSESHMPRLVEGSAPGGQLSAAAAQALGLQPGIVVAGGAENMSRVPMGSNRDLHGEAFGWMAAERYELTGQGEAAERQRASAGNGGILCCKRAEPEISPRRGGPGARECNPAIGTQRQRRSRRTDAAEGRTPEPGRSRHLARLGRFDRRRLYGASASGRLDGHPDLAPRRP